MANGKKLINKTSAKLFKIFKDPAVLAAGYVKIECRK